MSHETKQEVCNDTNYANCDAIMRLSKILRLYHSLSLQYKNSNDTQELASVIKNSIITSGNQNEFIEDFIHLRPGV